MTCIWCKKEDLARSKEHIIPEALGCPDNFIFNRGEVCKKCNNRLGNIDKALLHEFEVFAFFSGVPRKGGKKPKINSIPNLKGEYKGNHPFYYLNMESHPVITVNGEKLSAYNKNSSAIDFKITKVGQVGKMSFEQPIGRHKKFNRALTKIAFSSVAYFCGVEEVLTDEYDHIREYVLHGGAPRPILFLKQRDNKYRHNVTPPYVSDLDGSHYVELVIAGMGFIVDLSPKLCNYEKIKSELESDRKYDGWWYSVLPNNA